MRGKGRKEASKGEGEEGAVAAAPFRGRLERRCWQAAPGNAGMEGCVQPAPGLRALSLCCGGSRGCEVSIVRPQMLLNECYRLQAAGLN